MKSVASSISLKHLPTTRTMMLESLDFMTHRKGVSLKKYIKFICEKYKANISAKRKNLIKVCLKDWLHMNILQNVTGKGLNGSFRLVNKVEYAQQLVNSTFSVSKKARSNSSVHRTSSTPKSLIQNETNIITSTPLSSSKVKRMKKRRLQPLLSPPLDTTNHSKKQRKH